MRSTTLGDREVSAIGLGCMPLSVEGRPQADQSRATILAALDAGVTLLDTADAYHWHAGEVGHNELIVADALASYGSGARDVLVATKGGQVRPGDGRWVQVGRPEHLRQAARASARRLGVETIGLYQFHKPDAQVPFAESVGALVELVEDGVVAAAGLSNVDVEQILLAHELLGGDLVSVQNRLNPLDLTSLAQLRLCAELGIAFLPWSPLGRPGGGGGDLPDEFAAIGLAHGVSRYQVVLAWEMALSPVVVPIPGARRPETIVDSAAAAGLELSEHEIATLDRAVGLQG